MATAGSLTFVLSADSSQLRKELGNVQREAQFTAKAITGLFSGQAQENGIQAFAAAGLSGLSNLDKGLSATELLTRSLAAGVSSLIALPFPDFQEEALSSLGLGALNQALTTISLLATGIKALNTAFANGGQVSAFFKGLATSLRSTSSELDPVANKLDELSSSIDRIAAASKDSKIHLTGIEGIIAGFGHKLDSSQASVEQFQEAMEDLGNAAALFEGWKQASEIVDQFFGNLQQNFAAAKEAQNLRNRLELVSKSAGGAREDLSYLNNLTNELGVDFNAAAQGYTQFSTAANLANLSIDKTRSVFEGVTQATSAFGLSSADTQGVFLALQQSLSSGNVQLEELNQLAERIPGTFQAAAAALGVTTSELKKLISTGTVSSADFLPKFAEQLKSFTESGVVDAMNSGEAAVNRFNNALGDFSIAAGDAWLQVGTPALNTFAQAIEFAAQHEELFSTAIDALLVASVPLFISGITKATTAVMQFIQANQTATLQLFGQQISVTAAQLGKFGVQVGLAYAATILFYRVLDRVQDAAKTTRSAIVSLDKSLQDLQEAGQGSGKALTNALPQDPPPMDWLDAGVRGLKDLESQSGLAGKAFAAFAGGVPATLNKTINFFKTGNFEIVTAGEKALNDQLVAIGDFSQKAQTILGESLSFRQIAAQGNGPLKTLQDVEAALKRIEAQRLKTNPKDDQALAALAAEEADLLKRRGDAQKQVLANQTAINNALTQAKQELQNLDPSKLGTEGYEQAKQQLEVQISLLEKEKGQFDELTKQAEVTAQSIAANFEQASKQLDLAFAKTQADIQEALARGETDQEQAQQDQLAAEQHYLEDRLKLNRDAAEKLRTELERNSKLKAIDPTKATLSTDQEKDYQQQLEQIDTDIAKTRIDLAKNVLSTKQQLNQQELAKIRENQAEAEAILSRSENERIAAIKQRQISEGLSEEEANRQIAEVQKQSIVDQIQAEKDKQAQINTLKETGVISTKEAAEQEREILNKLSNLNLQRIDAELKARQEANQQTIAEFEDGIKQAEAAIAQSQNSRQQAIAKTQLGGLSGEAAARQEAEAEQAAIAQTLALRQKEFAEVQALRSRGVISAKEAASREAELIAQIGDLKLQQVNAEIQAQQNLINSLNQTATDQVKIVSNAETQKIAAIKQKQADRLLSEQQAAVDIAEINQAAVTENLRIKTEELNRLNALRNSGQITIEAGADQEKELIGEVAALRQQAAEAEIARQEQIKQAQLTALDQQLAAEQSVMQVRQGNNDLITQALESQNNLITAQSSLLQAQTDLAQQRLQFAIDEAEASGNSSQAEALKKQLLNEQIAAQQQQAELALRQLELQQQQNALELESKQLNAEIAVSEAQIAIAKAETNHATAEEISNLERIFNLRQQQLSALDHQAATQQQINVLEKQALLTQQQKTQEALQEQKAKLQTAAIGSSGGSFGEGDAGGAAGSVRGQVRYLTGQQLADSQRARYLASTEGKQTGSGQREYQLTDLLNVYSKATSEGIRQEVLNQFNDPNLNKLAKLVDAGQSFAASNLAQQAASGSSDSKLIATKLDQLISKLERPNLSISNVNDLSMAGRIYADISRDSARSAGL